MKSRIYDLRKSLGLTQAEFGERIGYKPTAIGMWERGERSVADSTVLLICNEYNVNEEWLHTGKGEMFSSKPSHLLDKLADMYHLSDFDRKLVAQFARLDKEQRKFIQHFAEQLFSDQTIDSTTKEVSHIPTQNNVIFFEDIKKERKEIPFLGQMAMGLPIDGDPEAYEGRTLFVDSGVAADYALRGVGDSMEPKIPDGSIVLVKATTELLDGQIGVFALDSEYSCKIFRKSNGIILLESINPAYQPLSFESVENVTMKGRIVGILEDSRTY